jgi:hypothetical protein
MKEKWITLSLPLKRFICPTVLIGMHVMTCRDSGEQEMGHTTMQK